MNTKILLINVHSRSNAGDDALFLSTIDQLEKQFELCKITVIVDDYKSYNHSYPIVYSLANWVKKADSEQPDRWHIGRLIGLFPATLIPICTYRLFKKPWFALTPRPVETILRAYIKADLVISSPGGFLYSSGKGTTFIMLIFSMALSFFFNKPLFIFPQSMGPLRRSWECFLLKFLLERAAVVLLREEESLKLLQRCRVQKEVHVLPDMAFLFSGVGRRAAKEWLAAQTSGRKDKRPLLGITLINWEAQNRSFRRQDIYEKAIEAAARYFVKEFGGRVIFFTQVWGPYKSQDDRIPARRVEERLSDLGNNILLVEGPIEANLLKSLHGEMDLFIGTRMHSNIFALTEYVPVIAIAYQYKTWGIMDMVGLGDWVIDIENVQSENLIVGLAKLWKERKNVQVHLAETIPNIVRDAEKAVKIVGRVYATYKNRRLDNG